jgi:hypothetical protein
MFMVHFFMRGSLFNYCAKIQIEAAEEAIKLEPDENQIWKIKGKISKNFTILHIIYFMVQHKQSRITHPFSRKKHRDV